MKENRTELVFILDRSGSMSHLTTDTIGGFNSMIEKQKQEPGEAFVTTILFDDQYEILHNHVDIQEIALMTNAQYYARGCTALLDAIGHTINSIGARLNNTPEEERPSKVIFTIITDGYENSSREFSRSQIKEMVEHQQDKYSWAFMFIGANMDAIAEGESLGVKAAFSKTYAASDVGTQSVYAAVDSAMCSMRSVAFDINDCSAQAYCDAVASLDTIV